MRLSPKSFDPDDPKWFKLAAWVGGIVTLVWLSFLVFVMVWIVKFGLEHW